jgi:putative glutamine amidotransferase
VGRGVIVAAFSSDGIVEALEAPDHPFAIAVQWHPEDCIHVNPADRRLFEAFACAIQTIQTR